MSREEKPTMQRRGVGVAGVLGPYTVERGWHPVHGCGVDVDWGMGSVLPKEEHRDMAGRLGGGP